MHGMDAVRRVFEFSSHSTYKSVSIRSSFLRRDAVLSNDSYDLPDDVFEIGEQKPTKVKKIKIGQQNGQKSSQKRSLSEAGIEVRMDLMSFDRNVSNLTLAQTI